MAFCFCCLAVGGGGVAAVTGRGVSRADGCRDEIPGGGGGGGCDTSSGGGRLGTGDWGQWIGDNKRFDLGLGTGDTRLGDKVLRTGDKGIDLNVRCVVTNPYHSSSPCSHTYR